MKILLLHHSADIGGGSRSLLDVAEMLRDDFALEVCGPARPEWLSKEVRQLGIEFRAALLPMPVYYHYNGTVGGLVRLYFFLRGIAIFLRYRRAWIDVIRDARVDVVAVNSAALCLFGPIIRAANSVPVCFVRESFPSRERSLGTRLLYWILRRYFSRSIFLSEHDRAKAALPPGETAVILDCLRPGTLRRVDRTEACARLGVSSNQVNVLFAGGASRLKGFDTALEAVERLSVEGVSMLVAGALPTASRTMPRRIRSLLANPREFAFNRHVRGLLDSPRVSSRVVSLGVQDDMSLAYSAADLVIFPSSLAHQSRPVYEAGFYGIPIVISDFANTDEFVVAGRNGVKVRSGSSRELADAILVLVEDRQLRRELGRENRRQFEQLRDYGRIKGLLVDTLVEAGECSIGSAESGHV